MDVDISGFRLTTMNDVSIVIWCIREILIEKKISAYATTILECANISTLHLSCYFYYYSSSPNY